MKFEHKDALGRLLKIGDCVAYPVNNSLIIGKIIKLNRKMIRVSQLGSKYTWDKNRYSYDVVLLEGPDLTVYILKQESK